MTDDNQRTVTSTSLTDVLRDTDINGPVWSQTSSDLNVNLIVLLAGHAIADHKNVEVDVLLVGVDGLGHVTIDGQTMTLAQGQVVIIPKGVARSIAPDGASFAYLTCHKRRGGLWPMPRT